MPHVRILDKSRIPLPPGPYPPPGDIVPLSFFDAYWISLPPVQRLFLFPDANLPLSSIAGSLKSSLSQTLPFFHPFAANLTYLPASGDAVLDCSSSAGVAFVEAESDLDLRRLASDEAHDLETFLQLVPEIDAGVLPSPVMAVQMTAFADGGVALGLAVHHVVADGRGLWRFLEAWAAACRTRGAPLGPPPSHDRAVIGLKAKGEEIARRFLEQLAPELPKITSADHSIRGRFELSRRTFTLGQTAIQILKQRVIRQRTTQTTDHSSSISAPTAFVALSGHAWLCLAQAKAVPADEPTALGFLADCRSRLRPPLDDGFTGNCVRPCFADARGAELAGPDGLALACKRIEEAIGRAGEEPLSGCEGWVEEFLRRAAGRMLYVVGSPRFRAYEADFGWGRPGRVELVSMNHDGEVVLVAGREEGAVQASVALSASQMEAFAEAFVGGCKG